MKVEKHYHETYSPASVQISLTPSPRTLIKGIKTTLPSAVLIKKADPRNKSIKHFYVKNQE